MLIYEKTEELKQAADQARHSGTRVGLVPTMGALHQGHASLIEAAVKENDWVAVSIFVNPTQFAPNEDLGAYPRSLEKDCELVKQCGAHAVFTPAVTEMYAPGDSTWVEVSGRLVEVLCGRSRPTHFRGVTTVVNKLFNLMGPCRAYFGQKDAQQAQIIKKMAADLFMPVEVRIMPIIREDDGLAISSRNAYLTPGERRAATVLSRTLQEAKVFIEGGDRKHQAALEFIEKHLKAEVLAVIDYVEINSFPDLAEPGEELHGEVLIALAVKFGGARLIDNLVVEAGLARG